MITIKMSTQSSDTDDENIIETNQDNDILDELLENISKTRINQGNNSSYLELLENNKKLSSNANLTDEFLFSLDVKMNEYLNYINYNLSKDNFDKQLHPLLDELEYLVVSYYYTLNNDKGTKFLLAKQFHRKLVFFLQSYMFIEINN